MSGRPWRRAVRLLAVLGATPLWSFLQVLPAATESSLQTPDHPAVETRVVSSDFSSTVLEIPLGSSYEEVVGPVGAGLVAVPPTAGVEAKVNAITIRRALTGGAWGQPVHGDPSAWPRLVSVSEPGIWRDLRVVSVAVNPRPAPDVLVERLTVELVYAGQGPNPLRHWGRPISPEFDRLYRAVVLNYEWLDVEPWSRSDAIRYLIIVADHLALETGPLWWWRNLTGMRAQIVTRSGIGGGTPADVGQIRSYISIAYHNWPQPPEFVVLVGDLGPPSSPPEEMPSYIRSGYAADHWYTLVDGNDYYADLLIGRIPTQQVSRCSYVVDKVIQYERDPLIELGITWQEKALMTGAAGPYPSITNAKRWAGQKLLTYGYEVVDSVYVPDMPGIDPDLMITMAVNQGRGVVNYRGHVTGSSGWTSLDFTSTDVQNYVHNGWRLPLVLSVSCDSGDYQNATCFGEYWLKIPENNGDTKGCIAFFGATDGTHTLWNNWLDKGIFVGLCEEGMGRVAEATEYGKLWMLANLGHSVTAEHAFYQYGVLGDPATLVWMDRPTALQVSHPAAIDPGPQAVTVWVKDNQGQALNGALVCAWKGAEVYQYAYTIIAGGINLAVSPATPGPMSLTVTARNMLPYEGTIQVTADVTPPAAIADLAISLTAQGQPALSWTEVTQDTTGAPETTDHYEVFRDTLAHLDPSGLPALAVVPYGTTSYVDAGSGVGDPSTNHFYAVLAVDQAGNSSACSNRVGEFDQALEP